jgi:hypothetical protein
MHGKLLLTPASQHDLSWIVLSLSLSLSLSSLLLHSPDKFQTCMQQKANLSMLSCCAAAPAVWRLLLVEGEKAPSSSIHWWRAIRYAD